MHHEREWPVATLILRGCSTLARRIAERRRPGQRQHIEVELPGPVLPTILRQRQAGGEHHDDNNGERTTEKRQTGHAIPPSLNTTTKDAQSLRTKLRRMESAGSQRECENIIRTKQK